MMLLCGAGEVKGAYYSMQKVAKARTRVLEASFKHQTGELGKSGSKVYSSPVVILGINISKNLRVQPQKCCLCTPLSSSKHVLKCLFEAYMATYSVIFPLNQEPEQAVSLVSQSQPSMASF